jgi:hypothetical protein
LVPAVVPVTFTENVQLPLAAIVPPVRPIEPLPVTAVMVPVPQAPATPLGVATSNPPGRPSRKPTPVSPALGLGLLIVKVREVDPFSGMVAAPKALTKVGGAATVMDAEVPL